MKEPAYGPGLNLQREQRFDLPSNIPWPELDRRYFAFAASLPTPLDRLACNRQLFTGKGDSISFHSLSELHPLITSLPWLFLDAFPGMSSGDVLDIAEAGIFLSMGMLLQDAEQDQQLDSQPGVSPLHTQLIIAAFRKFHACFEASSSFWSFFDQCVQEYTQALVLEKEHWGKVTEYPLELMYKIGHGKVALLKTIVAALALKGGDKTQIGQLEMAMDFLTAALQLGDDILDWPVDYRTRNFTLPLTWTIPVENWPVPSLTVQELEQLFERSYILEKLIVQVLEWFQSALTVVEELNCSGWMAFVNSCLRMTRNYQESFVARRLLRAIHLHPQYNE